MWDRPLIESDKAVVSAAYSDPINRARLNAVTSPHTGYWLSTIPVRNCGLDLSNEAIRVAIGLRLGLDLCTPHQLMSVRRDRRSKWPPRTGLQIICRKISQTLCRQRLSVEGSHEGGYPLPKRTLRSPQNGRQATGWGYTRPMG